MSDLITAVMVTGLPDRKKMALAAITAYREQTYQNRELLLVDHGHEPLLSRDEPGIKVIRTDPNQTIGALRNIYLAQAQGDWLIQMDDDDWSHPGRFEYQIGCTEPGKACLLRCQVRYDLLNHEMIYWRWTENHELEVPGIPGPILFPNKPGLKYRDLARSSDTYFIYDHFRGSVVVAENACIPHCYVRFFHGKNIWSRSHIMGTEEFPRPGVQATAYVQQVVDRYYKDALMVSEPLLASA